MVAVVVSGYFCHPVPVGGPQQVHVGQGAAEHEEEEGAEEHGKHSHAADQDENTFFNTRFNSNTSLIVECPECFSLWSGHCQFAVVQQRVVAPSP